MKLRATFPSLRGLVSAMAAALTLAAPAPAALIDIAGRGVASQTSEWNNGQFPASLALDGNPATFSHSDANTPNNAWQVRLDAEYPVAKVELAMRSDCCGGRMTGTTLRIFDSEGDPVFEATVVDPGPANVASFTMPPGTSARTVRVGFENGARNPSATTTLVHLGEVRVFTEIDLLPVIEAFAATPPQIASGAHTSLAWRVRGADRVEIPGLGLVAAESTQLESPLVSRVYGIVAANAHGSRSAGVGVIVDGLLLPPRITEFCAAQNSTLVRGDGSTPDWIEIWNPNPTPVDLAGWRLTDDPAAPSKFVFPPTVMPPGGYLVVDAADTSMDGVIATGFKLASAAGSYLGWLDPGGTTVQSFVYPAQRQDFSYGVDWLGQNKYFLRPTPGGPAEADVVDGFVADTRFSVKRGFFTTPQTVALTTATPSAVIYTTTNGSEPAPGNADASPYGAPLVIGTTTVLRAAAFRDGYLPTNIDTHSYIFPNQVASQSALPAGFPPQWVPNLTGVVNPVPAFAHYGMNGTVLSSLPLTAMDGASFGMPEALAAIPTFSLVVDSNVLFHPVSGLHVNARSRGRAWERRASIEILDPAGSVPVQAECGLRMQGGWNRYPEMLKKSLRLYFRSEYGDGKLRAPLFPGSRVEDFDRLILRSGNGKAWPSPWRALSGSGNSLERTTYLRDQFVRDLQASMGQSHVPGRFAHLFINGHYWGLYNPSERPDEHFASAHFGGADEDYDVIKWVRSTGRIVSAGTDEAWIALLALARSGAADATVYAQIAQRLDLVAFADYMLVNFYAGNSDWLDNNVYAIRNRATNGPFRLFCWDSEESFLSPSSDVTEGSVSGTCGELHQLLRTNAEYRVLFGDRAQRHFFHGGALTQPRSDATLMRRATEIDRAIVGESARWGSLLRPSAPYNRANWLTELANLRTNYLGPRVATTLAQLRADGLSPALAAPVFSPLRGGTVEAGFVLGLDSPPGQGGTVYYTTDGSDPRLPGGPVAASALVATSGTTRVTLVPFTSAWRYRDDGADLGGSHVTAGHPSYVPANWKHPAYDATSWAAGPAPLGYGSVSGLNIATTVGFGGDALNRHPTTYFRHSFTAADAGRMLTLRSGLRRDDGALVYLNGREIVRSGFTDPSASVAANTFAIGVNGAAEGTLHTFDLSPSLLVEGENILALELHQESLVSSDLGFELELFGDALAPEAGIPLTRDTLVRTRTLKDGQWSALDEALFVIGDRAQDLFLSEVMYHPAPPVSGEAEFIEIANRGTVTRTLADLRIRGGIQFDFSTSPILELAPGARLVLVRNLAAFQQAHPGVATAGVYLGALGNGGDAFSLETAGGTVLWTFAYDDAFPWPGGVDGGGHSLVHVAGDGNDPASWRPSVLPGGNPGSSDARPFTEGDQLAYAIAGLSVVGMPDGSIVLNLDTYLGSDSVSVSPEWSGDLRTWTSDGLILVDRATLGGGVERFRWLLPPGAGPERLFRARVCLR